MNEPIRTAARFVTTKSEYELPDPPAYLADAWESVWYVSGHERDNAWVIDDPEVLDIEDIYMRHVPPPPPGERGDHEEVMLTRDERGRFKTVWWWEVCEKAHPDAQPFMAVKYA